MNAKQKRLTSGTVRVKFAQMDFNRTSQNIDVLTTVRIFPSQDPLKIFIMAFAQEMTPQNFNVQICLQTAWQEKQTSHNG
jgi:hypothetical protein